MPQPSKTLPAAQPTRKIFDPWNTSITGHQRAENRLGGSTSWRDSRSAKLSEQFTAGLSGGKRVSDTVGAGSENFGKDGREENGRWEKGASGLREKGQRAIGEWMGGVKKTAAEQPKRKEKSIAEKWAESQARSAMSSITRSVPVVESASARDITRGVNLPANSTSASGTSAPSINVSADPLAIPLNADTPKPQIFANLSIFINGSTAPLIGDHTLKHVLAIHGARISVALGRRSVTHVILGKTSENNWCGGGLASSKIEKEVRRVGGKGVKFVGVEWYIMHYVCIMFQMN